MNPILDPVKYEMLYNRLAQALQEARNVTRILTGSLIVREAGETAEGFFLPNGDTVHLATGMTMHISTIARSIKYMNEQRYWEDIGIYEGDQFINNDPQIGGMHIPDMQIIAPVFYEDVRATGQSPLLVGWVGNFGHIAETGAIEPGGICPKATEFYHEGICLPCVKLVERGEVRRDIMLMMSRAVRVDRQINLDNRAKIAGNERAIKSIKKIIDEFGLDFFTEATQQMIEDGEAQAKAKLKRFKPGIYRSRMFSDTTGYEEKLSVVQLDLEITEDGRIILNTPVISPQRAGYNNCALPGVEGLTFSTLLSLIFYDIRWNWGTHRTISYNIPKGSILNAKKEAAVAYCPIGIGMQFMGNINDSISRAAFVSNLYKDIMAPCGSMNYLYIGGIDQFGRSCVEILPDSPAIGGGARWERDGLDASVSQWNPWTEIPDIETLEMGGPLLYLGRRNTPDTGGPGRYRGGAGAQVILTAHNTPYMGIGACGCAGHISGTQGIFGGYPSSATRLVVVDKSDLMDRIKNERPLPHCVDDVENIKGEVKYYFLSNPMRELKQDSDILAVHYWGGGGMGDPIEREPKLIVQDLINGLTTFWTVREVYRISIDPETMEVDYAETEKMRELKRKERLKKGIPAKEYVKKIVERRKKKDLPLPTLTFFEEMITYSKEFREQLEFEERFAAI